MIQVIEYIILEDFNEFFILGMVHDEELEEFVSKDNVMKKMRCILYQISNNTAPTEQYSKQGSTQDITAIKFRKIKFKNQKIAWRIFCKDFTINDSRTIILCELVQKKNVDSNNKRNKIIARMKQTQYVLESTKNNYER